jgi:hypothetical protein
MGIFAGRAATLAATMALFSATADAAEPGLGPIVRVSGASPFEGCTADGSGQQDGRFYAGSEVEPSAAADPRRPGNLLVAFQQDRWSSGASRGIVAAVSRDGALTWRTVVPPGITRCSGGPYLRATDAWVTMAPDGTAYLLSFALRTAQSPGATAMLASRSTDGGLSWGPPATLIRDDAPGVANDKGAITADPTDARYAYAIWHRDERRGGSVSARAFFARTADGGRSWEPARAIFDPGLGGQTLSNQIVVQPDGTVLHFTVETLPDGQTRGVVFQRSADKGKSFGPGERSEALSALQIRRDATLTPDSRKQLRPAVLADVAVDPRTGALYVAWQDIRFRGVGEIAFAMSDGKGAPFRWSAPIRVSRTPASPNPLRRQAFGPTVAVAANGVIVVTYYDFRFDLADRSELVDHWAATCDPKAADCSRPGSWRETRLTGASFDLLQAPDAGGLMLGEYMEIPSAGRRAWPVWIATDGPGRTVVRTRALAWPPS